MKNIYLLLCSVESFTAQSTRWENQTSVYFTYEENLTVFYSRMMSGDIKSNL